MRRAAVLFLCTASLLVQGEDICSTRETCVQCLRSPNCTWCGQPPLEGLTGSVPLRCRARGTTTADWCRADYVIDKEPKQEVKQNYPLSDSKNDNVVQLAPQSVKVLLRVGQPHELTIRYRHAKDYPVDLYYLMDLSYSMKDDKDELSSLGNELASAMKNLTTNFRLGFGSFVDKVTMPFTSTAKKRLLNPCSPNECAPPFSFKNNMPLTENTEEFEKKVHASEVSGNLDSPEGGLDALLQAIVCPEIGWREKARRMIIFSTDAGFHIAGDGRLAGIIQPNDGLCHLKDGMYTESLNLDYPSISQISRQAQDNTTNIIFAVTRNFVGLYKRLSENIDGSSVQMLSENSSNVVKLVVDEYKKLSDSVELTDDRSKNLEVRYYSKCPNSSKSEETSKCGGLKRGIEVAFTVNITAKRCSDNAGLIEKQVLHINPVGINERITVDLEIVCGCDCNKSNMSEVNSETCNKHGDLECGLCSCHRGYLGDRCNCTSDSSSPTTEDTSGCKDENNVTCSGHGKCRCNSCECDTRRNSMEKYYGRLCECDNYSCKRYEKKVCAGNGNCNCGRCECQPGWQGEACECEDTMDGCKRFGESTVCSGHGHCVCGQCVCNQTSDGYYYSGQYCEECPSCPGALCKDFEVCVEYEMNDNKLPKQLEECRKQKSISSISRVDNIQAQDENEYESYDGDKDKTCRVADDEGCTMHFRYRSLESEYKIWVQKEKDCGPNITGVIFGVIGATVLIGLLIILIWKILTTIHDKREYAKFEKERALSKWDRGGNPLYTPSTSTFTNPTFNKS